ncbi:MAG: hypothetical protein M0P12_00215 [Paludibacteraceae bacterium]|jgi:hypothetical protein|nr:hypothetical protein [Paludibacteraceae bacterium]MCK9615565.1 hypothetical protein [Candidatus Omnitrophota bacterium]
MSRRVRYNSILVKDKETDGFLLIPIINGRIKSQGILLDISTDIISGWLENGSLPENRILLAEAKIEGENQYFITKASIDMVLDGKEVNFWNIIDNPDYISYFLQKVKI